MKGFFCLGCLAREVELKTRFFDKNNHVTTLNLELGILGKKTGSILRFLELYTQTGQSFDINNSCHVVLKHYFLR